MDQGKQQDQFYEELNKVIDRYIDEYDLTIASAIGTLEMIKLELFMDQVIEPKDEKD